LISFAANDRILRYCKKIEVLYGPASAVYGPNAFLGIVNIITKDPVSIKTGDNYFVTNIHYGSYDTQSIDLAAGGREGGLAYSVSARLYETEGPGLDDFTKEWGYLTDEQLGNRTTWGPLLNVGNQAGSLGRYANPSNGYGVLGETSFGNFKAGMINWQLATTFGPYYAGDRAQGNVFWYTESRQAYLEHQSKPTKSASINTLLLRRWSAISGNWAEAEPDWNDPDSRMSYISYSDWNTDNSSWLFKQDYNYTITDTLHLLGGIKYQFKELTRAYDLCSYWDGSYCSNLDIVDPSDPGYLGPTGNGQGIGHSTDDTYVVQPDTLNEMPSGNIVNTTDKGIYTLAIWDFSHYRLNAGIRYDKNSLYGSAVSPRVSVIYHLAENSTLKLLYGEAFQEPAALQLFGGWSGRLANPDLDPEKAQNVEMIFMYQMANWLHDVSLYRANYKDVIKEEAENAGEREVTGLEYRGRFQFANFLDNAADITGYLYYAYTQSKSDIIYDHNLGEWIDGSDDLGDIARHKINAGLNMPLGKYFNFNILANYVGDRELYLRNPLRKQGEEIDAYVTFDTNLRFEWNYLSVTFKVKNLLDEGYFHPGVEAANSGNDFSQRSQGYQNSLIPQTGRSFWFNFRLSL